MKEQLEALGQQHQELVEWSQLRSNMVQQRELEMKKLESKVDVQAQLLDSCHRIMTGRSNFDVHLTDDAEFWS